MFCGAPRPLRRAGEREISGTFGENRGKTGNFFGFVANPRRILYTVSKKQPSRRREGKGEGNEKENGCRLCAGGGAELCASGRVRHGTNNLSGEETKSSVTELSALEGYTVTGIDRLGVVSASRTDADTEYVLYSAERGGIMGFFADGFHAGCGGAVCIVRRTVGRARFIPCTARTAGRLADGRVGRIGPRLSTSNGTVTFPNGDVLYVGVDGEVHTAAITALTPYARYGRVTRLGDDCYVESVGEGLNVFDKNGKYLRTVSADSLFDIPADAAQADTAAWVVGTRS